MYKILISIFVSFVLGFFTHHFKVKNLPAAKTPSLDTASCASLAEAKSNLISISQKDYLEYTEIKDLRQKYEKADEILGKVMLLFLADIGFRLQKQTVGEPAPQAVLTAESKQMQMPPDQNTSDHTKLPMIAIDTAVKKNSPLVGKSNLINSSISEKQINDVLRLAIIDNPKLEILNGPSPTHKHIRKLEGRYLGFVKFFDLKRENLRLTWELIPDNSKDHLSGSFYLKIDGGPGKESESNWNGSLDRIVSLAEDPNGFLVSGCGEYCFLQLYYNVPKDQFFGNFYEIANGSKTKTERVGTLELKK